MSWVRLKKPAMYAGVVFVLYTIVTAPTEAASVAHAGGEALIVSARGVGEFFQALVNPS